MSKVKVNEIDKRSGSTLTLGGSGTTVQLGTGATQTGFGRTGTVNWDTTAKTAAFTAVSGNGYFVNTTSAAITVTLPASPSAGDIVYVKDYTGTFGTNNCTIARNSSKIRGGTDDFVLEKSNSGAAFIYIDATEGWQIFIDGSTADAQATFLSATGGTITTCGNYKIHTFTSPGTFTVETVSCNSADNEVDYLVVGGGGGSAGGAGGNCARGGAGGGGFRFSASTFSSPSCSPGHPLRSTVGITVSTQAYPITVGAGGSAGGAADPSPGVTNGSDSIFSTITSAGGGFGAKVNGGGGNPGGSGGGSTISSSAGSGNTPPVSPPQGKDGGTGTNSSPYAAGGGGGAAQAGSPNPGNVSGAGGDGAGIPTAFGSNGVPCGSFRYYAGGGGGGRGYSPSANGAGGKGGGGAGGDSPLLGTAGTANTGGGAGGTGQQSGGAATPGAAGGSGIVVIRYKFQ